MSAVLRKSEGASFPEEIGDHRMMFVSDLAAINAGQRLLRHSGKDYFASLAMTEILYSNCPTRAFASGGMVLLWRG